MKPLAAFLLGILACSAVWWMARTWPATDAPAGSARDARLDDLERELAALRARLDRSPGHDTWEVSRPPRGPALSVPPAPGAEPVAPPVAPAQRAPAAVREAQLHAAAKRKAWHAAVSSLTDPAGRQAALDEMLEAMGGDDQPLRVHALSYARWLGDVPYDKQAFRRAIERRVGDEDIETRVAAAIALAYVEPMGVDVEALVRVAELGTGDGEQIALALNRLSHGVWEGRAADGALVLLGDGYPTKKAFVMRGMKGPVRMEPRVEARLLEIVRAASPQDYDSAYFFHFITPDLRPKSDAVVDLLVEAMGTSDRDLRMVVRSFQTGLDERQKQRAAQALLRIAESADRASVQRHLATAVDSVASATDRSRMEALAARYEADTAISALWRQAAERPRPR
ncbi:MAG: hypothetical protein R3F05_17800 [Planctomycetota bacterium]